MIRLKILIGAHLQVVDHHGGPPPAGLRRDALDDVAGYLGDGLGQRPADDDVDFHRVWTDHHTGDLLGAVVGRGLDVTTAAHGVDPFRGEGPPRGGPPPPDIRLPALPRAPSAP